MKNMVSLLMAALVASVLASGCGDKLHKECNDAKKSDECVEAKFEKDAFKGKCTWLPDAKEDKKGVCEQSADVEGKIRAVCEDGTTAQQDNDGCAALIAKQKSAAGNKECKHDTSATAKASKCKLQ